MRGTFFHSRKILWAPLWWVLFLSSHRVWGDNPSVWTTLAARRWQSARLLGRVLFVIHLSRQIRWRITYDNVTQHVSHWLQSTTNLILPTCPCEFDGCFVLVSSSMLMDSLGNEVEALLLCHQLPSLLSNRLYLLLPRRVWRLFLECCDWTCQPSPRRTQLLHRDCDGLGWRRKPSDRET